MSTTPRVPFDVDDPIGHLLASGESYLTLAVAFGYQTTQSVRDLQAFKYVPSPKITPKIATLFGWTPGQVFDYWFRRVNERAAAGVTPKPELSDQRSAR